MTIPGEGGGMSRSQDGFSSSYSSLIFLFSSYSFSSFSSSSYLFSLSSFSSLLFLFSSLSISFFFALFPHFLEIKIIMKSNVRYSPHYEPSNKQLNNTLISYGQPTKILVSGAYSNVYEEVGPNGSVAIKFSRPVRQDRGKAPSEDFVLETSMLRRL